MSKNYILRKFDTEEKISGGGLVFSIVGEILSRNDKNIFLHILRCFPESTVPLQTCQLMKIKNPDDPYDNFGFIQINDWFYKEVYLKDYSLTNGMIFHELGHYLNGDLNLDMKKLRLERKIALLNDTILENEANADYFAAQEVGLKCVIDSIQFMKNKRNACIRDANYHLAIKEFDLRISALQKKFNIDDNK